MNQQRASNPGSGARLLDESKANPAAFDMSAFQRQSSGSGAAGGGGSGAPVGQGTTNSNYQQECEEQNPAPASEAQDKASVSLSGCKFLTAQADLKLNEEFECSVDVKKIGEPETRRAYFTLYCTRTRDGKEDRAKMWAKTEGFPVDEKADPIVVKAKGVLATQSDYMLGEPVKFELEASHGDAKEVCKSEVMEFKVMTQANWFGGEDLGFRADGEFPRLNPDASLIQVLANVVTRVEMPPQKSRETVICFGFAGSGGDATKNRQLSLRRAKAVKAILERDSAAWGELAKANFETQDMQQFLSDLHAACGWEVDPGSIDGKAGAKTKAAIKLFQQEANGRYALGLTEDGDCGPKTWNAVLRAIHGQIQDALGQDSTKAPTWKKPTWGHSGKGVFANGQDFSSGGSKAEEESVQITFFSPGSEPALKDAADAETTTPKHNPVQNQDVVEKKKAPSTPVKAPTSGGSAAPAAAGGPLRTSSVGIDLIAQYEGFKARVYNCPAGHATIGYGILLHKGGKTAADDAKYPNGVTEAEAKTMLKNVLPDMEKALLKAVKVALSQNQFDALMSWVYNLGTGRLVEKDCSWLRELNAGHYEKVGDGLKMWNKANGVVMAGLTKRRAAEADLFGSQAPSGGSAPAVAPTPAPEVVAPNSGTGGGVAGDYGSFDLKMGDNDAKKIWGGSVRAESAAYIKVLQQDLAKLGYWLTKTDERIGCVADGDFKGGMESAVKTFQLEHFGMNADGTFVANWKSLVTGVVNSATKDKIKQEVIACGNKSWHRPSHRPRGTWTANGVKKEMGENIRFYQVPPSQGYNRRSLATSSTEVMTWTKTYSGVATELVAKCYEVIPGEALDWIMVDSWGQRELVNMLKNTGDQWAKVHPDLPFGIGDMSTFRGGALKPHAGHRDGDGVDLSGPRASIERFVSTSDRDLAMELAKLLHANGAVRILFNCNHLIKSLPYVKSMDGHGNHMHVDVVDARVTTAKGICSDCKVKNCESKK